MALKIKKYLHFMFIYQDYVVFCIENCDVKYFILIAKATLGNFAVYENVTCT